MKNKHLIKDINKFETEIEAEAPINKKLKISEANNVPSSLPDEDLKNFRKEFFKQLEELLPLFIRILLFIFVAVLIVMITIYFINTEALSIIKDFKEILILLKDGIIFILGGIFLKKKG